MIKLQEEVSKLISATLGEREREIIRLYYGLDKECLTWEDISKRYIFNLKASWLIVTSSRWIFELSLDKLQDRIIEREGETGRSCGAGETKTRSEEEKNGGNDPQELILFLYIFITSEP